MSDNSHRLLSAATFFLDKTGLPIAYGLRHGYRLTATLR